MACDQGHEHMCELLLKVSLDAQTLAEDYIGHNYIGPIARLWLKTARNRLRCNLQLWQAGADTLAKDVTGTTAIVIAERNRDVNIVNLIGRSRTPARLDAVITHIRLDGL